MKNKNKVIRPQNVAAMSLRLPQFSKRVIPNKRKNPVKFNKRDASH